MAVPDSYINVSPETLKSLSDAGYRNVKFVVSPASSWPGPGGWVAPLDDADPEFQSLYIEGLRKLAAAD